MMNKSDFVKILVEETGLQQTQVSQTVDLLEEGSTVPFIARYRKEATGELDEVQIRLLQERLNYFKELDDRRQTILKSIEEQGKLSPALKTQILNCRQKTDLEDLYLPYKPKRRTKATIAKEQGLEPLADLIIQATSSHPELESLAAAFVDAEKAVPDAGIALTGAGYILAERFADEAKARAAVRDLTWSRGLFCSQPVRGKEGTVSKYEMYYDFSEALRDIPSHRMLAMRRGEKEETLRLQVDAPEDQIMATLYQLLIPVDHPFSHWLQQVSGDAYQRLLAPSIEVELRLQAKKKADDDAIQVFAENLRNLLLAAPVGSRRVLGVDPGLRTGSKLAAVDGTGRFLEHTTIYPHTGGGRVESAEQDLIRLIKPTRLKWLPLVTELLAERWISLSASL